MSASLCSVMYERQSHPTGVRGLKFEIKTANANRGRVAPHWGAWIEIYGRILTGERK